MTHDIDCSIKAEFEEEVNRIAGEYWDGDQNRAEDRAMELGWEILGGGAGRTAWRVPSDVAEEHPCVVKFATGKGRHNGTKQNREEINQWRNFPERVRDAEPPVIAPVRDWGEDMLWLTMPEVEPGGSDVEVTRRLAQLGWACEDLHYDNIGTIHGESVVLDYGLECYETAMPADLADDIRGFLGDAHIDNEPVGAGQGEITVYFETPEYIGKSGDVDPSSFSVGQMGEMRFAQYNFGTWPEDQDGAVADAAQRVADGIEDEWFQVIAWAHQRTSRGEIHVEMEFETPGWDAAFTIEEFHDDVIALAEDHFPNAEDPQMFLQDVRIGMEDAVDDISGQKTETITDTDGNLIAGWDFFPPADAPGYKNRQDAPSYVQVSSDGLHEMRAAFGPWRAGEPQATRAVSRADKLVKHLQEQWPNVEFNWRKWDLGDGVEVDLTVAPEEDADPLSADGIARLYTDIYHEAMNFLPAGRGTGEPVQDDLDVFSVIDGAIMAAVCPTGDRCDAQAEAYAADLYDDFYGNGPDVPHNRVNEEVAEMVERNSDLGTDTSDGSLTVEGRNWNFWDRVVADAARAPPEKDSFIEEVSSAVTGYAEEVLRAH